MNQGVIGKYKVHYWCHVIERLLIDVSTGRSPVERKVTLVKAALFANGAWRDLKSKTILHCLETGSLRRHMLISRITLVLRQMPLKH